MKKFINGALASGLCASMLLGASSVGLAKGHGHGHERGNNATAHSCINPAGNVRGWCRSQGANLTFVTGTVSSINGRYATITLSNGQTIRVRNNGFTVGQTVTLRGAYNSNGQFVAGNGGVYTNYNGPYSSSSVSGMIIAMNGTTLTIVSGLRLITINDANASINRNLAVGTSITANGNWSGSTFIANSIQ